MVESWFGLFAAWRFNVARRREFDKKKSGALSSRSGRSVGGAVAAHPSIYQTTAGRRVAGKGITGGREETTPTNDIRQLLARKLQEKEVRGERSEVGMGAGRNDRALT